MSEILPKSSSVVFPVVKSILDMGWITVPPQFNGHGAPGNTLESLLDVDENNNDSPDLLDWEVKFHGGNSLITLFHKTPLPRGIMNKVVNEFGWPNEKDQLSFRHTLRGKSERGFYVHNEDDRITIKNTVNEDIEPYWDHNTILNALAAKLRRLILFEGVYDSANRRVDYQKATAYWNVDIMKFCKSIEEGIVYVDFDARTKGGKGTSLRDHGTKFRINVRDIGSIYLNSYVIRENDPLPSNLELF
jgi:hypothetical protein